MKALSIIIILFLSTYSYAQFDCENIKLLGIYKNNVQTQELTILVSNLSPNDDGNANVYTSFDLINATEDTIFNSSQVYSLPNSMRDTFAYQIPIHDQYNNIYDLPDFRCGTLFTQFPNCEINFCFEDLVELDLPHSNYLDCNDFKVVGIYDTAHGGITNYSVILTNTNSDSLRNWDLGYTSFECVNANNEPISNTTWPSYVVPSNYGDTIVFQLDFLEALASNEIITLRMRNSDCDLNFSTTTTSIKAEPIKYNYHIYPNPTSEMLFIETDELLESIDIFDEQGKLIAKSKGKVIDTSELGIGTYFLQIHFKNGTVSDKFFRY